MWHLHDGKAQIGPLDEDHVLRMIDAGLPAETLAKEIDAEKWISLRGYPAFAMAIERRVAVGVPTPVQEPAAAHQAGVRDQIVKGVVAFGTVTIIGIVLVAFSQCDNRECSQAILSASAALEVNQFDELRSPLQQAKAFCGSHHAYEIAAMDQKLKVHDESEARASATKKTAVAAQKERDAVETFPSEVERIRDAIKAASVALAKNTMSKAAPFVKTARVILDEFKDTSIEKTDSWVALDAKTSELERKVQPYVDDVNATLAAVKAAHAKEDAVDRAAGYQETKDGYTGSTDLDKLKKALAYLQAGDKEGYVLLVQNDPDVISMKPHLRVIPFEHAGFAGSYIHARVKGTLTELWMVKEALTTF